MKQVMGRLLLGVVVGSLLGSASFCESRGATQIQEGTGRNGDGVVASGLQKYRVVVNSATGAVSPATSLRATEVQSTTAVRARAVPRAIRPNGGPGSPGITTASAGFGSVTLASQPVSRTVTFDGSAGPLTFATTVGTDYSISSTSCSSTCSVQVSFSPQYPGLRNDAITATNSSGTLVAETFLSGTGVGPLFGFELGGVTYYKGFANQPGGVALGPDRRGYVTDSDTNSVYRFNRYAPNNFNFTRLDIQDLGTPAGVAIDGANTVYVADQTNNVIVYYYERVQNAVIVPVQGTVATSALSSPTGVAVDGSGALYITDTGNGRVLKIDNQGQETTLASGLTVPTGIAVDSAGDVFWVDSGSGGEITEIAFGSNTSVSIATSLGSPRGIAIDSAGRIYFTTPEGYGFIFGSNQQLPPGSGTDGPFGVAVGPNGDVYFTQETDGTFEIIDRSSGNVILSTTVGGTTQGTVTGSNVGNSPLTINGTPVSSTAFTIDASSSCAPGTVLNPADQCSVQVNFSPVTPGDDTETLRINSDSLKREASNQFTLYGQAGNTTTTLAVSSNSLATGQAVTFSATVANDQGSVAPTGQVSFLDGTTSLGTGTLTASATAGNQAVAQFTTSSLALGNHSISAAYLGSDTLAQSTSGAQTVTVVAGTIATTTTLMVSPSNVSAGAAETLTATIQGGTGPAISGTVTFYDQNGALGSGNVTGTSTGAVATLTISYLSVGSHQVYGLYNGDGTYAPSTSGTQTVTVTRAITTTMLTLSATTISAGQPETLTATIAGAASPVLTGTVTFFQGTPSVPSTTLGSATVTATSTGATSSLTVSSLPVGSDPVYASYSGDNNYLGSVAGTQTVAVTGAATGTTATLTVDRASVVYRTPIALMTTVRTTDGGVVSAGQVIFCDVSAAHCTPETSLATAQLNGSGVATAHLGSAGVIGSHGFTAIFLGTGGYLRSVSGTQTVVVTMQSPYSDFATIVSTGNPGSYGLTATVTGLFTRANAPTGVVSFNDVTDPMSPMTLGTATLGTATLGFVALQPITSPNAVGRGAYGIATGDFNGDGYADLALENYNANSVCILLGKGNGDFQPQVTYAVGSLPERVLVADFNGDGNLDLVVANTGSNTVSILLGNGDGTFQTQVTYAVGSPVGLGVMDLNHDGFADIVAGDYYNGTVSVLLGNGDGTLQAAVTYATGSTPQTLAEGDFNGDGNVDVAVGNEGSGTVGVLLGNGDGTFRAQVTYAVGRQPQGVQVGDFNGDGNDDLAVSNQGDGTISVLLGSGDGTFQGQVAYAVGGQPVGLAIADFDGDGIQDLSVGNTAQSSLTQSILLGNGDGTFQAQKAYKTGNFPYGEAVADFNGDGSPDLAVANFNDATVTILLSAVTQTATASIAGVSVGSPSGTHTVVASYAGDANFAAGVSPSIPLMTATATPVSSATSLGITPASQTVGQSVVFSVSVVGSTQTTPAPTGTVTLTNTGVSPAVVLGTVTLGSTGAGSLSTASLGVGTYSVVASYGGDGMYAASASGIQTLAVNPVVTTTSLGASAAAISVGQTETLTATIAGSGAGSLSGTVTFSDQSGVLGTGIVTATSSGGMATLTLTTLPVGTHRIVASYGGVTNYGASSGGPQSVAVSQVTQTIAFAPIANHRVGDATFAVNATASSGLAVSYAVLSGPATITNNLVTVSGVGTVAIQATQAGNTTYAAAAPATQSFVVSLATQTIAFPTIGSHTVGDTAFALNATATSGLPVSFAVVSGPATIAGNQLTVTGVGTVVVQATQAGNTTYAAATAVTQSFTVVASAVPVVASAAPATAVIGASATTVTLTGTNFAARDVVQLNGATIASTFVSATTISAVVPASFLGAAGTGQITVIDQASGTTSGAVPFVVLARPTVVFTGPSSSTSAQQPAVTLQLVNPYPNALTGTLTLTFAPTAATGIDDPAVQFASGGRTLAFTIPANSTVTPAVQLQTGTVAGTATVTLGLVSSGLNVTPGNAAPVVITIATAVPTVTTATLTRSGSTLTVVVHGFSNTREVAMATFHFTASTGSAVSDPDVSVPATATFSSWYSSTASAQYGSSFTYTQQFTLDQDVSTIGSVAVMLTNSVGNSVSASAQ